MEGLLGLLIAESALNPRAERWGKDTRHAQILIERLESGSNGATLQELQDLIDAQWMDISFGYGQRIVAYHWWGDGTSHVSNVLSVRKAVFGNPNRDILEAAFRFSNGWKAATGMDEPLIKAMVHYNAGHIPLPNDPWWKRWAGNVASYRAALSRARSILADGGGI